MRKDRGAAFHPFGMKLNAEDGKIVVHKAFNHPVVGKSNRCEPPPYPTDALVVAAVGGKRPAVNLLKDIGRFDFVCQVIARCDMIVGNHQMLD